MRLVALSMLVIGCLAALPGRWQECVGRPSCPAPASLRHRLSTKTDYDDSQSELSAGAAAARERGCLPVQLQLVSRHGARYPTPKDWRRKISPLFARLRGLRLDLPLANYTQEQLGTLTPRGERQLAGLGRRVAAVFPGLVGPNGGRANLEASYKRRAVQSAEWFRRGAWGQGSQLPVKSRETEDSQSDRILRAFDACGTWRDQAHSERADEESDKWKQGERLTEAARLLSGRLGVQMSVGELLALLKSCGYLMLSEDAWQMGSPEEPGLCRLLDGVDLSAIEYYVDLKKFYGYGYGRPVNLQLARPLLQLIQREWALPDLSGSFRFGHAETVLPLLAALGLYNDSFVLTADTPDELMQGRKWNMSQVSPMATNLLLVLYDCSGRRQVQTFHNERIVHLPFCQASPDGLCTVDDWAARFPSYSYDDWSQACNLEQPS